MNDITSKIIATCIPNDYETSSNIMKISPDIAARVIDLMMDIQCLIEKKFQVNFELVKKDLQQNDSAGYFIRETKDEEMNDSRNVATRDVRSNRNHQNNEQNNDGINDEDRNDTIDINITINTDGIYDIINSQYYEDEDMNYDENDQNLMNSNRQMIMKIMKEKKVN